MKASLVLLLLSLLGVTSVRAQWCSPTAPWGICPNPGAACIWGSCTATGTLCSSAAPAGYCNTGMICVNGKCIVVSSSCSSGTPQGPCSKAGQVCADAICIDEDNGGDLCSPKNPTGSCTEAGASCTNGVCTTAETICSSTNGNGLCGVGKFCNRGTCVTSAFGDGSNYGGGNGGSSNGGIDIGDLAGGGGVGGVGGGLVAAAPGTSAPGVIGFIALVAVAMMLM
jgi:hypothetical protein